MQIWKEAIIALIYRGGVNLRFHSRFPAELIYTAEVYKSCILVVLSTKQNCLFIESSMAENGEARAIGIDLGTTYSCAAVWKHGHVEIIPNDRGNRTTPSYVAFTRTERLVGNAAKDQVALNPTNTVFGKIISSLFTCLKLT